MATKPVPIRREPAPDDARELASAEHEGYRARLYDDGEFFWLVIDGQDGIVITGKSLLITVCLHIIRVRSRELRIPDAVLTPLLLDVEETAFTHQNSCPFTTLIAERTSA